MGFHDSSIISALKKLRQEDCQEFPAKLHSNLQVSLRYTVRHCQQQTITKTKDRRVQNLIVKKTSHSGDEHVVYYDGVL